MVREYTVDGWADSLLTPRILHGKTSSAPIILDRTAKVAVGLVAAAGLLVLFGGGSARPDVPYLVLVRVGAIMSLAALLLLLPRERLRADRSALIFMGATAIAMAVQLIPLPPAVWSALPGRQPYETLNSVAELDGIWRPINLSPDLGWNALFSLLPPLFFLIAIPTLGIRQRHWVLKGLLITVVLSGFLGLLQVAGGPSSPLRHYPYTNLDAATGFFANRNHQAVFLAMGIPLAVWWATLRSSRPRRQTPRLVIAASIVLFLLTATVSTQSRSGAATIVVSLVLTALFLMRRLGLTRRTVLWLAGGTVLALALAAAAFASWGQQRRGPEAIAEDLRIRILPESIEAARTFFPVGAGFGSFPHVFRRFESNEDLAPTYVNHTHNELTEIVIEGGLVSILLLLLFLGWYVLVAYRAWSKRLERHHQGRAADAQLCTILIALPLLASVTDYPIRTPLMACTLAIAAVILAAAHREMRVTKLGPD